MCPLWCCRMYYHFRPDYWFWIVIILGRKLMIAVTALMFNKNPAFQMAIALLVLFICYALQVRTAAKTACCVWLGGGCIVPTVHTSFLLASTMQVRNTPYMSMSERVDVLNDHRRRALTGDPKHMLLMTTISQVKHAGRRQGVAASMDLQKQRAIMGSTVNFFWNYNTVESVLLFSAVLVNLAVSGICVGVSVNVVVLL